MDDFDKIAEGLLPCMRIQYDLPPCPDDDGDIAPCDMCELHRPAVAAKLREMGEEIERLTVERNGYGDMCQELTTERDAAYLKGLERARDIAGICSGTSATAYDWIAHAIDEAKGKVNG